MTAANTTVLEGQLVLDDSSSLLLLFTTFFPLQAEVTIVIQNDSPGDPAIHYAYEQVVLEERMFTNGGRVGTTTTTTTLDYDPVTFRLTQYNTTYMAGEWQLKEQEQQSVVATTTETTSSPASWRTWARLSLALVLWFSSLW